MKIMTATKRKFGKLNSWSQNTVFQQFSHHHYLCTFTSNQQEPACCVPKILHQWRQPITMVTTAEPHHPSTHCAHVYCLVSVNAQWASVNVSGCHFFLFPFLPFFPCISEHLNDFREIPVEYCSTAVNISIVRKTV